MRSHQSSKVQISSLNWSLAPTKTKFLCVCVFLGVCVCMWVCECVCAHIFVFGFILLIDVFLIVFVNVCQQNVSNFIIYQIRQYWWLFKKSAWEFFHQAKKSIRYFNENIQMDHFLLSSTIDFDWFMDFIEMVISISMAIYTTFRKKSTTKPKHHKWFSGLFTWQAATVSCWQSHRASIICKAQRHQITLHWSRKPVWSTDFTTSWISRLLARLAQSGKHFVFIISIEIPFSPSLYLHLSRSLTQFPFWNIQNIVSIRPLSLKKNRNFVFVLKNSRTKFPLLNH